MTSGLGPDVQSECRPAPAPTLAKAIQDRGAAVAKDQVDSKIACLPGSRLCSISKNSAFDVSGISPYMPPYVISGWVEAIVPQPPHGPLGLKLGAVTAVGATEAVAGVQGDQEPSPVLRGVEAATEPRFAVGIAPAVKTGQDHNRACPCPERTSMPLRSTRYPVRQVQLSICVCSAALCLSRIHMCVLLLLSTRSSSIATASRCCVVCTQAYRHQQPPSLTDGIVQVPSVSIKQLCQSFDPEIV